MDLELGGKTVLITGAGSGMGQHMAVGFAREGANVAVNDIDPKGVAETIAQVKAAGGQAHDATADITSLTTVRDMVSATESALGGIDIENVAIVAGRSGKPNQVPRITGPIKRVGPVEVRDVEFLRANTDRTIKITIPGPFTMTQQAQNDYYPDGEAAAMGYAEAVNEEIKALYAAGADIVQLDEPYMQASPDEARKYAVKAINRALDGVTGTTALHICFGYAHTITTEKTGGYNFLAELEDCVVRQVSVEAAQPKLDLSILSVLPSKKLIVGVIDMGDPNVETAEMVADRVRNAVAHAPAERLVIAPDCGMKYLDRKVAFGKLKAMVDGTKIVRKELAG